MPSRKKRSRPARQTRDPNEAILAALKDGELSTKALAAEVGLSSGAVYGRCRHLEEKGLLKSQLKHCTGPMYCVDDDEIITRLQYDRCREEGHDLRPIDGVQRVWSLKAKS